MLAATPMGVLGWIVLPLLASDAGSDPLGFGVTRLVLLALGLVWLFVLTMIIVRREEGDLRWVTVKRRLRLNTPRDPRTGRPRARLWLWVIPFLVAVAIVELLVQDFDVDRRNDDFVLKCLRLEGDGPGFPQEKVRFPKALPRGDLVLDLGDANWAQLYPFVVASNCPHCRYRETYFIDRWNDRKGKVVLKSFERGHTEEKKEIASTLASLTDIQKLGT